MEKIFVFTLRDSSKDPYAPKKTVAIPQSAIHLIEALSGGERVTLSVNGYEVEGYLGDVLKEFEIVKIA